MEKIKKLKKNEYIIELYYMLAHINIVKNKLANKMVKKAIGFKLKKIVKKKTRKLNIGSTTTQTLLVKELVLVKVAILEKKKYN